jgi:hypothetical protein
VKASAATTAPPAVPTEREIAAKFRDAFAELAAFFATDPHVYSQILMSIGASLTHFSVNPTQAAEMLSTIRYPGDSQ